MFMLQNRDSVAMPSGHSAQLLPVGVLLVLELSMPAIALHRLQRKPLYFNSTRQLYIHPLQRNRRGVILENVVGMLHHQADGEEPPMTKFLRVLEDMLPEMCWRVDVLGAVDYLLPHTRVRCFLRGMARTVVYSVPPPLPAFGKRVLREALGKFPFTPRASFTTNQQENIKEYENTINLKYGRGHSQGLVSNMLRHLSPQLYK